MVRQLAIPSPAVCECAKPRMRARNVACSRLPACPPAVPLPRAVPCSGCRGFTARSGGGSPRSSPAKKLSNHARPRAARVVPEPAAAAAADSSETEGEIAPASQLPAGPSA